MHKPAHRIASGRVKSGLAVVGMVAATGAAVAGAASAAQPTKNGTYVDKKHNLTIFMQGQKSINTSSTRSSRSSDIGPAPARR